MKSYPWRIGIGPLSLFYFVFFVLPQCAFLVISLYKTTGPGQIGNTLTLSNYAMIWGDAFFRRAILNTLELSAITAVGSILIGYPLAYRISQSRRYGKYLFTLVVAIMFSSAVALALGWQALLSPNTGVNGLLMTLSLISSPLPFSANFASIAIATVHGAVPIAVIGILPACEAIPKAHLEASTGLGASQWYVFRSVILPQTFRTVASMGLIVFAITTSIFTTPALLGGGQVALVPLAIREQVLTLFDYPKSAALAATLIFITLAIIIASNLLLRTRSIPSAQSAKTA